MQMIFEMELFGELVKRVAAARERIKKIEAQNVKYTPVLALLTIAVGVLIMLTLAIFKMFDLFGTSTGTQVVAFAVLSACLVFVMFNSVWRIIIARLSVFMWWNREFNRSIVRTDKLLEKLQSESDPDEHTCMAYACTMSRSARTVLREIIESLRVDFSCKIPDKEIFYQEILSGVSCDDVRDPDILAQFGISDPGKDDDPPPPFALA